MAINKLVAGALFVACAIFALVLVLLLLGKEGAYKEDNRLKYYLITPALIADVPRVSDSYFFTYTPDDNYGFARYSIEFNNIKNYQQANELLDNYVISKRKGLDSKTDDLVVNSYEVDQTKLGVTLLEYTHR